VIACRVLEAAGEVSVGLAVDEDYIPAVAHYKSLGFSKAPVQSPDDQVRPRARFAAHPGGPYSVAGHPGPARDE